MTMTTPADAYGGTVYTIVASHIVVCSDYEDYPTTAAASLPNGWAVCTDTAWMANADGTNVPDSVRLHTADVCGGGGIHEYTN